MDQLERDGLVERADGAYRPTPACEELRPLIFGLAEWGARWAFGEPRPDELDPTVLMWWIRGGIDPDRLLDAGPAGGRAVLHVRVPDARRSRFWFVATPGDVSLCFTDPGFEVDVTVESSLGVLYQVWLGAVSSRGRARRRVTLTGRRELVRRLPDALRLSPVAPYVRRGAGPGPGRGMSRTRRGDVRGFNPRAPPPCGTLLRVIARTSPPLGAGCCPGCRCRRHADTPGPVRHRRVRGPHESAITLMSAPELPPSVPGPPLPGLTCPHRICAATPSWSSTPTPTTRRSSPG